MEHCFEEEELESSIMSLKLVINLLSMNKGGARRISVSLPTYLPTYQSFNVQNLHGQKTLGNLFKID